MDVDGIDGEEFRAALSARLQDLGKGQTWLAVEVGNELGREPYSQAHIADWLRGRRNPSPAQVFAIERALNMTPGRLSRSLGYLPADARPVSSVEEAVRADRSLTPRHREAVLALYRALSDPGKEG